jgi:hypothetical protein
VNASSAPLRAWLQYHDGHVKEIRHWGGWWVSERYETAPGRIRELWFIASHRLNGDVVYRQYGRLRRPWTKRGRRKVPNRRALGSRWHLFTKTRRM